MGSAALYHLARRGERVLGIEQFDVAHDRGSSHGASRIIRLAYYEHPSYVPLLRRAYLLWRELERNADRRLLHITGSIDASIPGGTSRIFENSLRSCELHSLDHEILTSAALTRRFPGYRLPGDVMAVLQPEGGFLEPEECIRAHVRGAMAAGAELQPQERVRSWTAQDGVRVITDRGEYRAKRLVLTAGAWTAKLVPELARVAVPERQVVVWFAPKQPELFTPDRFPVFNLGVDDGHYYGFPIFGHPGVKLGRYHHRGEIADPDSVDRTVHAEDERILRRAAEEFFPDAAGAAIAATTCLFTNSPDEHFIVDLHPSFPNVAIAAGFSGHGFKFCSVIGEMLAELVVAGETLQERSLFRLERFGVDAG